MNILLLFNASLHTAKFQFFGIRTSRGITRQLLQTKHPQIASISLCNDDLWSLFRSFSIFVASLGRVHRYVRQV